MRLWKRDIGNSAVVLCAKGEAEIVNVDGETVRASSGTYVVDTKARFWISKPIPAGWMTVYVEKNPEPVTERPHVGYDAKTLDVLVGDFALHIVGAGFKGAGPQIGMRKVLIIALVLLALAGTAYMWYRRTAAEHGIPTPEGG